LEERTATKNNSTKATTWSKIGKRNKLDDDGNPKPYTGGIVFRTPEDALNYLEQNGKADKFSVLQVDADWDTDVYEEDGSHYLLHDRPIVPPKSWVKAMAAHTGRQWEGKYNKTEITCKHCKWSGKVIWPEFLLAPPQDLQCPGCNGSILLMFVSPFQTEEFEPDELSG
jgi:hypothetical protein